MTLQDRLDTYLAENDLEAVWFARPNSFAWITDGGDNVVSRASDVGVAAAGYDGDGITVVTNNIEAGRLGDEEVGDDVSFETFQWYEEDLPEAVAKWSPRPAAADFDVPGMTSVDATSLRQPLTDHQVGTLREVAAEVAESLEAVGRRTEATDTEREVTADLHGELEARGISAPVGLIGSGERAQAYRHFTSRDVELGEYGILTVTGYRDGFYVSCTRTVTFDAPDWLAERTRDAMRVEATALAATREVGRNGGTASDVFAAIQDAYAELGWEGEWQNHHQGGAAGYAGREWIATPSNDASVELPMAYAWNPTIQGAKSEDLHLVTEDDVELASTTGEWPTEEASAVGYDLRIERHAPLQR